MLQTEGFTDVEGLGGGLNDGSLGGGGLEVGGGLTVGFTGTIGFSVSVEGTGGQTLFSNLTTDPGRSSEWLGLMLSPSLGLVGESLSTHSKVTIILNQESNTMFPGSTEWSGLTEENTSAWPRTRWAARRTSPQHSPSGLGLRSRSPGHACNRLRAMM